MNNSPPKRITRSRAAKVGTNTTLPAVSENPVTTHATSKPVGRVTKKPVTALKARSTRNDTSTTATTTRLSGKRKARSEENEDDDGDSSKNQKGGNTTVVTIGGHRGATHKKVALSKPSQNNAGAQQSKQLHRSLPRRMTQASNRATASTAATRSKRKSPTPAEIAAKAAAATTLGVTAGTSSTKPATATRSHKASSSTDAKGSAVEVGAPAATAAGVKALHQPSRSAPSKLPEPSAKVASKKTVTFANDDAANSAPQVKSGLAVCKSKKVAAAPAVPSTSVSTGSRSTRTGRNAAGATTAGAATTTGNRSSALAKSKAAAPVKPKSSTAEKTPLSPRKVTQMPMKKSCEDDDKATTRSSPTTTDATEEQEEDGADGTQDGHAEEENALLNRLPIKARIMAGSTTTILATVENDGGHTDEKLVLDHGVSAAMSTAIDGSPKRGLNAEALALLGSPARKLRASKLDGPGASSSSTTNALAAVVGFMSSPAKRVGSAAVTSNVPTDGADCAFNKGINSSPTKSLLFKTPAKRGLFPPVKLNPGGDRYEEQDANAGSLLFNSPAKRGSPTKKADIFVKSSRRPLVAPTIPEHEEYNETHDKPAPEKLFKPEATTGVAWAHDHDAMEVDSHQPVEQGAGDAADGPEEIASNTSRRRSTRSDFRLRQKELDVMVNMTSDSEESTVLAPNHEAFEYEAESRAQQTLAKCNTPGGRVKSNHQLGFTPLAKRLEQWRPRKSMSPAMEDEQPTDATGRNMQHEEEHDEEHEKEHEEEQEKEGHNNENKHEDDVVESDDESGEDIASVNHFNVSYENEMAEPMHHYNETVDGDEDIDEAELEALGEALEEELEILSSAQKIMQKREASPFDPFDDIDITGEDVALAMEANEMSVMFPDNDVEMTGLDDDEAHEETMQLTEGNHQLEVEEEMTQQYGDENAMPTDPAMSAADGSTIQIPAVTPARSYGTRVVHTISKVPLKPADESVTRRSTLSFKPKRRASAMPVLPNGRQEQMDRIRAIRKVSSPTPSPLSPVEHGRRHTVADTLDIDDVMDIDVIDNDDGSVGKQQDPTVTKGENDQNETGTSDISISITPSTPQVHPRQLQQMSNLVTPAPPSSRLSYNIHSPAGRTPTGGVNAGIELDPDEPTGPPVLDGVVVYVDVHTAEGADASMIFVELLAQMGAKCVKHWHWTPPSNDEQANQSKQQNITHVVFKDGSKRTLDRVKETNGAVKCVGVSWVLDCERESRWVPEAIYTIDPSVAPRTNSRRRSMEPRSVVNMHGKLVSSKSPSDSLAGPASSSRSTRPGRHSLAPTSTVGGKSRSARRESAIWVRTPADASAAERKRRRTTIGNPTVQHHESLDSDSDAEMIGQLKRATEIDASQDDNDKATSDGGEWDLSTFLAPVPTTPAPEKIAEFAANVSPDTTDMSLMLAEDDQLGPLGFGGMATPSIPQRSLRFGNSRRGRGDMTCPPIVRFADINEHNDEKDLDLGMIDPSLLASTTTTTTTTTTKTFSARLGVSSSSSSQIPVNMNTDMGMDAATRRNITGMTIGTVGPLAGNMNTDIGVGMGLGSRTMSSATGITAANLSMGVGGNSNLPKSERDERLLMRLMAARRKSLQFAPKVGSPLARTWKQ